MVRREVEGVGMWDFVCVNEGGGRGWKRKKDA